MYGRVGPSSTGVSKSHRRRPCKDRGKVAIDRKVKAMALIERLALRAE